MTNIEAMKLALDALEVYGEHSQDCPQWPTYTKPEDYPKCDCGYDDAIAALRQQISEAEQREWVGLTEEEVEAYETMGGKSDAMLARAIEARLKEKNK